MHIKNSLLCCTFLALIISTTPVNAAGIAPALTTPDEQFRQRQLESQEHQRQQEILKSLRQQQEIKTDVRDEVDALKQIPLKASIDIPDNETPCFAINKIELVGDDVAKFQFALDEVLSKNIPSANETEAKPILGRCLSVGIDDSGLNSTGKYLGNTTLSGDNLLSLSDMFYVNYNHDLGGGDAGKRGTKGYTAYYSIPWDYWLLSATTSSFDYHQEVAGASQNYIYSGTSQNAEIKLNRLVYRNSINKTNLSLRGFLRKSFNYIDDTEIEVQRRRTAGWELGFNQSWYLGAAILDCNLAYRRGTGAEDALKAPEEGFGEGTSRMKMLLGDINLSVPFAVDTPWGSQALQYTANLRGQANYTPLTPQDRFSIGSRFTVRGFDGQQTLIADHGWLIRNELIAPIASSGQSVYWGLDYGEVGGQSSEYLIGKYLAGTVLGLRGGVGSQRFGSLSYDVFVGKPINKPQGFATHESVAGFSLNYSY